MKLGLLFLAACLAPSFAAAAPVGDALQRPAVTVKAPQRAVLLSAAWAGERVVAVGERGVIALSDDSGATWRQAPSPVSVTLTAVRFADATHGVAVGHGGTVLTSRDSGATWSVRLDGRRVAALAKAVARTHEAQKEAERLEADGPDKPFLDVLVWDSKRLLVVGAYGLALHSSDGGASWVPWMDRLPNPKALHWYVARRAGDVLLLAGEQGILARSTDGGQSFQPITSPYKGSWFAAEVKSDGAWVLAGLRGNVWRSPDQGANWLRIASPVPASIMAMASPANGPLMLATQSGVLLRLQDEALVPMNQQQPVPMPAALLALRDGGLLAFGMSGATRLPALEKVARP